MKPSTVVPYGDDPLQTIRVYRHDYSHRLSLILIHGGAWRDPNNTFDDFEDLVAHLPANVNVFALNYRLSPVVKHPAHLEDVVSALCYLQKHYRIENVGIVGHSVGATLALQLLNHTHILHLEALQLTISLRLLAFLDGIYDIKQLLEEYPSYASFVNEAFQNEADYINASPLALKMPPFDILVDSCTIEVVQSTEDELLSENQTVLMANFLHEHSLKYTKHTGSFGSHEQVYRNSQVGQIIADGISQ